MDCNYRYIGTRHFAFSLTQSNQRWRSVLESVRMLTFYQIAIKKFTG